MDSRNTEINENNNAPHGGWVFYDGACGLCSSSAKGFEGMLKRRGFAVAPLQTPWVRARLGMREDEPLTEMKILTRSGAILGGADAVIFLCRSFWWAWPLPLLGRIPGMGHIITRTYHWVAVNRSRISGTCTLRDSCGWVGWLVLAVLPLSAFAIKSRLPAWGFMWALAFAMFTGFKWLTWWQTQAAGVRTTRARVLAYLLLWPGMDAKAFLDADHQSNQPSATVWAFAISKTVFGALLLWGIARLVPDQHGLLRGWVGLAGLVFLLHFGSFHLIALFWQRAGLDARPIMNAPILATSLGDFWGNRWNQGFRQLSHALIFRPLRESVGHVAAGLAVFLASGLIHELVISVPAGAGYGLPTGYFLLQGIGVLIERCRLGQWLGFSRGLTGWLFTAACVAGPAYWLFHPPFVDRVVIPFMRALGAL